MMNEEIIVLEPNSLTLAKESLEYISAINQQAADLSAELKSVKSKLLGLMATHNIKSFSNDAVKVTLVPGSTYSKVCFDEEAFAKEHPKIYKQYCKPMSKDRAAYVIITNKKEEEI